MRSSRLFVVETVLSACFGLLTVATLVRRDWLESLALDADGGSGALEWIIVAAFLAASVLLGLHAQRTQRRVDREVPGPGSGRDEVA